MGDLDNVFSVDYDNNLFTVPHTEDTGKAKVYEIHYHVVYDDYPGVFISTEKPFTFIVDDPCDPPAILETNAPLVD